MKLICVTLYLPRAVSEQDKKNVNAQNLRNSLSSVRYLSGVRAHWRTCVQRTQTWRQTCHSLAIGCRCRDIVRTVRSIEHDEPRSEKLSTNTVCYAATAQKHRIWYSKHQHATGFSGNCATGLFTPELSMKWTITLHREKDAAKKIDASSCVTDSSWQTRGNVSL